MKGLTTHILDLTHGHPAAHVKIELTRMEDANRRFLTTTVTNQDGRVNDPLLTSESMTQGEYELLVHIGDYFRTKGFNLEETPFLDKVIVRFGINDSHCDYHIPLLISPYGYQVYRGT